METLPCTSDSGGAATVFVDTSLDTHLAMIVSDTDTVSEFKKRIQQEHSSCFPDVGEIKILALKVKRKGKFYHLSDSMFVKMAFRSVCDSWFLSADASAANEHSDNYNPHSGNLIGFRSTDANTSADVVDLLPDGPSKRSSNADDTCLLQDESNQIMKHQSVVSQSHSRDYPKKISANLQIGKANNADSNPTILSPVPGNGPGRKDEGQRDFVNLSVSGNISKLPEPGKEKRKRQREYAVEKLSGVNIMAVNSLKECSRREITSSGEGEKGINEEYPDSILRIQDQISTGKALQSGPTAKRLRETLTEGGENSLVENVNSDSDKNGTGLEEVRRSSNNVEGENVDYQNGFISTRSNLIGNPNVESLRVRETVGRHVDGEANTTLASGSISAGISFSEQYFASPDRRQELKENNNVVSTKYYDAVQTGNGDMERQNVEPELGLSSENAGSAQVDHHHPDEAGHPSLLVQQPADLGDGVLEHNNRTVIPGDEMAEPKRSSKKTNQLSKTHDQVRPQACGRGDNLRGLMRKEDPSYISEHPINLKDSEHDDRSGIMECEVREPVITNKLKKYKKMHDPVEAEAASDIERNEDTPSMVPQSDKGDHLSNITIKVGQALRSQQSSGNSLNDIETSRPESEVAESKKSSKKKRKSKKVEDQGGAEIASGAEHYGAPPHIVSSAEVPVPVRGDGLTDANTIEDPPSLSQQHNNLLKNEVSEYHNGSITLEVDILEPKKNSKKRKGSKKALDQVVLETASGLEHSGPSANSLSSVRVPRSARVDDMIDSSPKGKPPSISQLSNNLLQDVDSKSDDQSATLETIAVEPKTKKRKKSRHSQVELGVQTPALLEHSGCPRNDTSSAEVPITASADDLTDAVLENYPPFSSQQSNDLRHDVSQFGNGSAPLEDDSLKPKRNSKDRTKSRKTQDQAGIEASSITRKSGGITNDVSVSEGAGSVRGSYLGEITWNSDLLSASHLPNNPLVATALLNDNESGTPVTEVEKPTKSLKRTKKIKKIEDHAGAMSLGTGHSGETMKDISQVHISGSGDHLIDVATDEIADNRIRNVLDSLQKIETEEPNAVDMKSSKKAKKQKSSLVADTLTQISDDAGHKDHGVSASYVDKVKSPSKSTRKSKRLNSNSTNQFSRLNLKVEDGRDINNLPKRGMLVMGSSHIDIGIPLEATFEKDGPDCNVECLQKSESVKNQSRSNIVADGEVSNNGKQTNSKDIKKVQVHKIKKLDQPSSEPGSASFPKLNENQDLGVQVHTEVPVSEAMSAQSNKLKITFKDAQRPDSTVKSSHGKAVTEYITSVINANRKSGERTPKVTVRNSSQKNGSEVVNSSKPMRSLLGSPLFKDIEESSDDEDETNDSDTSTRTPSINSALLDNSYNDSDTDADSKQTGQKDSGKSETRARYVSPKNMSLVEIMMSSSRYKKAKLVAAESQPDDEDDEEFVPNSQPK